MDYILEKIKKLFLFLHRFSQATAMDMLEINTEDLLVESKLFMAKFTFEKISLGLHSRGK